MIIAIDGPAASGKGTIARRLAAHYGLPHLDTGLLYRAVARALLDFDHPLGDETAAVRAAQALDRSHLDETRLRGREMGEAASVVAALPAVRAALVDWQRAFARRPEGAVLDGRDIGTVICPDAPVKIFVTATPEERARRRFKELAGRGESVIFEDVLDDIRRRDARDSGRATAPLAVAPDARLLDTTSLDIEQEPLPRRFRRAPRRELRQDRDERRLRRQGHRVVGIEKDLAIIDVGLKTEGRVALKEFTGPGREGDIKIGDEVEVYLERIENALGEAVISRDKARREESWVKLEKAFNANEKVTGTIFNTVKGGYTVDLDGAVAFLPRSQVDIRPIRDVGPLMNSPQPFQILKMDRRRGNIVVSRRTVLEETRAEQRHELVQNLEEGQVIDGVVKNITDYGAFVDLGGIDGLLHVTDIAWRRVNHPSEVLTIGQTVKVKIVKINHETHRISLGMKQLLDDPWQGIEAKYPINAKFKGRVTNITDYGAFVELEPGIEGLIHVSEMSWTKKNVHPGKIVSTSQEVEVSVLEVDSSSAASRWASSRPCRTRGKPSSRSTRSAPSSRARSRTRPSSVCSSVSRATWTAWSTCPTSTGTVRASRSSRSSRRATWSAPRSSTSTWRRSASRSA
jgi:cytidylate kinase